MLNEFKVPIVVIGASILGLEIIEQLVSKGNHVVVIEKKYDGRTHSNAVLRNQHTLQSGLLQSLSLSSSLDDSSEVLQNGFIRIARGYRDVMRKYGDVGIVSNKNSFIHIECDESNQESIVERHISNVKTLSHNLSYQRILIGDELNTAKEEIGNLYVKSEVNEIIFELPEKAIDYDKLLKIRKNYIVNTSKEGLGKVFFVPRSEKVTLVKTDGGYLIGTDQISFKTKYVIVAAGNGTNEVLSDIYPNGDGSKAMGYNLLKTSDSCSFSRSFNLSTFAKYQNANGMKQFIFAAKHGNKSISDTSFLIFSNGVGFSPKSISKSFSTIEKNSKDLIDKSIKKLKHGISNLFKITLKNLDKNISKPSFCILRYGKSVYFPHIFLDESNPNLISGHAGLTSTAVEVAEELIEKLFKLQENSNLKIEQNQARNLTVFCLEENRVIQEKSKSKNVINRRDELSSEDDAWFRESQKYLKI